jgi:acyl-CoA thioester hydrolase
MAKSDFQFSFLFRVRYSEIDGQSIVFNAHYLTYFDTALTEYMRHLGYDYNAQVEETNTDFHTVKTLVEYKSPINLDEEIDVHVRAARLGRSSLSFQVEIHGHDKDDLRATGEVVWVNADQATHSSAPLPVRLTELLMKVEGPEIQTA